MNLIKKKLADKLTLTALVELDNLKNDPDCEGECNRDDVDQAIRNDVERIVNTISFSEGAKILTLVAKLDRAQGEKAEKIGAELAVLAENIIVRVEEAEGALNFTKSCRKMYLKFGR